MIRLIAFLGNPGPGYARNRHNAGWHLAQALPFYASLGWQKKYKGRYAALDSGRIVSAAVHITENIQTDEPDDLPEKFHFIMPETYMNLSGESVCAAASFFKIKLEEILVVHDELEIPLGTLSLKYSGGLGGHNGLRSMKACFGSADFWRLRIGIGRPNHDDISGWVLSDFTAAETETLNPVLDAGAVLLIRTLTGKPEKLLGEWAKKKIVKEAPIYSIENKSVLL
ncbi:MAG: aminoacyl-tRNA hydrolase [Treponema sp.]|jgi:PTH1 family peptidyl-tRNA hydrolase|nr:aminoacyl-tRNA hydrolase [Treponema sp.]